MVTGSRIALARARRGWSVTRLASRLGVARQTVAAWESEAQTPSDHNLAALAAVLAFPVSFFTQPHIEPVPMDAMSFRAMSKMTAGTRESARAAGRIALLVNEWIESRYKLPGPDVPTLGRHSPAHAAEIVRSYWGLGHAPIANLTHLLESRGVRVFSVPDDCRTVDAFSLRWFDTPLVLVTPGKSAERRRFDLAHELGHLVLHGEAENVQGQAAEEAANNFAAAFLMPRAGLLSRPLRNATLDTILRERSYWKVAAMAMTYRLHELGFLSDWSYRNHCVELSRRGFRRGEPGGAPSETSQLLSKVMRSLRAKNIGVADIALDLGVPTDELVAHLLELVVLPLEGGGAVPRSQDPPPRLRLA